jgi:hypothetical protein
MYAYQQTFAGVSRTKITCRHDVHMDMNLYVHMHLPTPLHRAYVHIHTSSSKTRKKLKTLIEPKTQAISAATELENVIPGLGDDLHAKLIAIRLLEPSDKAPGWPDGRF